MAIFHFFQFEHELFCWYFKRLNAFLAQCGYCVGKWEILGSIDDSVINETQILFQYWDFHRLNVMKLGLCLSWLLGTRLSLKRPVVFLDILFSIHGHFMLGHIMLLFGVTCVILPTIMLIHVHIMHAMSILIRPKHARI